jgi:hypothetical protein
LEKRRLPFVGAVDTILANEWQVAALIPDIFSEKSANLGLVFVETLIPQSHDPVAAFLRPFQQGNSNLEAEFPVNKQIRFLLHAFPSVSAAAINTLRERGSWRSYR